MRFTKNILFKTFKNNLNTSSTRKIFLSTIKNKNEVLDSLSRDYKYSFSNKFIKRFKKKFLFLRIIGMGGSILGTKAIFRFLNFKIKKKIVFIDNLSPSIKNKKLKKNTLNLIVSKSGSTLETIVNTNVLINKKQNNIFITENTGNYLKLLAKKLKSEIIHHNNFIGGRYSVLSEVGMLPASLVGLNEKNFKQFNNLIKNKNFTNSLISNVANILFMIKKKTFNSIIINYDESSEDLFKWYQQLVAESLGKKGKGVLPLISTMPKDNHSLMQHYLDGPKNNFFTFFYVKENKSDKINNNFILKDLNFLKNKKIMDILYSQKKATENVLSIKKIPYRSFEIKKRDERTLGELFTFFILETIMIAKALNINPYDQPSVELIKKETKKNLNK